MARLLLLVWLAAAGCLSGCGAAQQERRDLCAQTGWFGASPESPEKDEWLGGDATARAVIFTLAVAAIVAISVGALALAPQVGLSG